MKNRFLRYILALTIISLGHLHGMCQNNPSEALAYYGKSEQNIHSAADKKLTGKVVDANGEMMPGVNVVIKGTTNGTVTDVNGAFNIIVPEGTTLVFSFIGYVSQEIRVGAQNTINVVLVSNTEDIDEVVVIGYGTVQKKDLTGSVSSIRSADLEKAPINTLDQALQGRVAGVVFSQASGQPGGMSSIRIRGNGSINASNEPLYVIDGIPIINDDQGSSAGAARGSALNALSSLNVDDIESMEVLKDASATAIYGARGANGVIMVTTKKGKKGPMKISFDSYYGIQEPVKMLDILNAKEYAHTINESRYTQGLEPLYDLSTLGEGTDWQDAIFRTSPIMNFNFSARGGNEKTNYSLSYSYFNQEGIIIGSDFNRYSVRANIDSEITSKLKLGTIISLGYVKSNGVITEDGFLQNGAVTSALRFNPMLPVRDASGKYTYEDDRIANLGNPVASIMETTNERTNTRGMVNSYLEYEIVKGLKARVNLGADAFFNKGNLFAPPGLVETRASKGDGNVATIHGLTLLNENTLTYSKDFSKDHKLNLLAGFTAQKFESELLNAATLGYSNAALGHHALQVGTTSLTPVTYTTTSGLISYLGRVNYILKDKYLFTVNGRVDGSSKFGAGNKYGFFPSGAFAWRMSNEEFMKNSKFFDDLKFRASYGLTGNQEIPSNRTISLLTVTEVLFDDVTVQKGFAPSNLANRNLKWESTAQFDLGIDAAFLKNRFTLTADYYHKKTTDLLVSIPIAETSGFTSAFSNIGSIENKGLELSLGANNKFRNFYWNSSFNISFNKNKVLDLKGNDRITNDFGSVGNISGWQIVFEGEELGTFYGYQFDGIVQENDDFSKVPKIPSNPTINPGDRKYKDLTGDGFITEEDKAVIGHAQPDFVFGFNNDFLYKGFELNVFVQGSVGSDIANFNKLFLESLNGYSNNLREAVANRWTPQNPSNKYPRIATDRTDVSGFSDIYVEDGSFVRLKNVMFGYNFKQNTLSKLHIGSLKLYVSASNLLTLTKYSGYDPELNRFANDNLSQGADYGGYPNAKIYKVGLKLGF